MDYIGSKEKLNKWIFENIELYFSKKQWKKLLFLDACSGSGSVSKYAIRNNFKVISNDLFKFSSAIVSGYSSIKNSNLSIVKKHINNINKLKGIEGFFFNNYSEIGNRLYFSIKNTKLIDAARLYIEEKVDNKKIKNYLLYCSLEAMSRVLNTTGVQAAYLKKIKPRALSKFNLKLEKYYNSSCVNTFNKDILFLLNNEKFRKRYKEDIFYLDPPYNYRQYGPNYHLYETFVKNDKPIIVGKTGLRNWKNESDSKFCSRKKCLDFLEKVLNSTCAKLVIISYSSDGLLSKKEIENLSLTRLEIQKPTKILSQKRYKADNKRKNNTNKLEEYLFLFS